MSKRSIHIEDILEDCVIAVQEQGKTIAECLLQYPNHRDELEPLLYLATHLQTARVLQAPAEFRQVSAIRMRNLVAARPRPVRSTPAKQTVVPPIWQKVASLFQAPGRRPATLVLSALFALWLFISGAVYAARGSLPGGVLYPVKRAVETTQLAVSLSEAGDTRLHLLFATRRLDEASALLASNRPQEIGDALAGYQTQLAMALAPLNRENNLSRDQKVDLANLLVSELARHEAQLAALSDRAPQYSYQDVEVALAVVQAARDRALTVLSNSGEETAGLRPTATPTATSLPAMAPAVSTTPSPSPSSTSTSPPASPTPSPTRTRATPSPSSPVWQAPPYWPEGCPRPPDWPAEWPETCRVPRAWLEWWSHWPEECAVPPDWPSDRPEACPLPPEWLEDWWQQWPDDCPIPPHWPEEWPESCSAPPERLEWWQQWPDECRDAYTWPPEWPENCPAPAIVVPTVPTIIVPTIIVPTIVVPTVVVPTVEVPTIEVPTVNVPTVEAPPIPTVEVPNISIPGIP